MSIATKTADAAAVAAPLNALSPEIPAFDASDVSPARPAASQSLYPPGVTNANWFSLFNATCWQIMMGVPTILYAKSQGANSTMLGTLAALVPLLGVLQLPAAHLLPRFGYRKFLLAGWGSRSILIFAVACVPMLSFATPTWRLWLVFVCLVGFNALRGATVGAWMPWLSELIPQPVRGRFIARDQMFQQVGSLTALFGSALLLTGSARPWQFSLVFLLSAAGATVSLLFLRVIPDVTAPEKLKSSGHRVPWAAMLMYRPFLIITIFSIICAMMNGAVNVFTIQFLNDMDPLKFSDSRIPLLTMMAGAGALTTLTFIGRCLDRTGSKPILFACLLTNGVILLGWWAMASGLVGKSLLFVALLYLAMGVAGSNFITANNRLLMGTVPVMGRNHFFALYLVIGNLTAGLAPILWGLVLDKIGPRQWLSMGVQWNRHSLFFAAISLTSLVAAGFGLLLHEPKTVGNTQ